MVDFVQIDALAVHAREVHDQEHHEAFIVAIQHDLHKEWLVVHRVHEYARNQGQLRIVLHHLHYIAHLGIHTHLLLLKLSLRRA